MSNEKNKETKRRTTFVSVGGTIRVLKYFFCKFVCSFCSSYVESVCVCVYVRVGVLFLLFAADCRSGPLFGRIFVSFRIP